MKGTQLSFLLLPQSLIFAESVPFCTGSLLIFGCLALFFYSVF